MLRTKREEGNWNNSSFFIVFFANLKKVLWEENFKWLLFLKNHKFVGLFNGWLRYLKNKLRSEKWSWSNNWVFRRAVFCLPTSFLKKLKGCLKISRSGIWNADFYFEIGFIVKKHSTNCSRICRSWSNN